MIDPELKTSLNEINTHLVEFKTKKSAGIWRSFFNGMFNALGYIVGFIIVIVLLVWFLNKMGVLPEFQKQVETFQKFIGSAEKLINSTSDNNQQQNNNATTTNSQNSYMITLPDGRKAEVIPQ